MSSPPQEKELFEFLNQNSKIVIFVGKDNIYDSLPAAVSIAIVALSLKKSVYIKTPNQTIPSQLLFLNFNNILTSLSFYNKKTSFIIKSKNISALYYVKENDALSVSALDENKNLILCRDIIFLDPKKEASSSIFIGISDEETREASKNKVFTETLTIRAQENESICEGVARSLKKNGEKYITNQTATSLMTGISATSGNFQNPKTKPQTLFMAAYLTSCGADKETIIRSLYKTRSSSFVKIWGTLLSRFFYDEENRFGYSILTKEELGAAGFQEKELFVLLNDLKATSSRSNFILIGIQNRQTLICLCSVVEESADKVKERVGVNSKNLSFAFPIKIRTSAKKELEIVSKAISRAI